jgi:hypothetical protein
VIGGLPKVAKRWSAKLFQKKISAELKKRGLLSLGKKAIGNTTTCEWLRQLGMELVDEKKGIYKDGHERPDVIAARIAYVKENADFYDACMVHYSGDEMDVVVPAANGEATHVSVYHDETIVAQNEGKSRYWGQADSQDKCFSKGKGKSLMVSGFICDCHGAMEVEAGEWMNEETPATKKAPGVTTLPPTETTSTKHHQPTMDAFLSTSSGGGVPAESRFAAPAPSPRRKSKSSGDDTPVAKGPFHHSTKMFGEKMLSSFTVFEPGANAQGYWTGQDVVDQAVEVERIFSKLHPNQIGVFEFDNSTNHSVLPPGALHVGVGVNKNPGGTNAPGSLKNPVKMRDGWFIDKKTKKRVAQKMHQKAGTFKGTHAILKERGVIPVPTLGKCTKASRLAKKKESLTECSPTARCCCHNVRLTMHACKFGFSQCYVAHTDRYFTVQNPLTIQTLRNSPDFLEQKTALEEFLESKGHVCRMLPKMHPELNPIESYWAMMKVYLREVCDYNVAGLRKNLPDSVRSVPIATVRRHFRRSARFRSLYLREVELGEPMPFRLREYFMKKYSRHRQVPQFALEAIDADLGKREGVCIERGKRSSSVANEKRLSGIKRLKHKAAQYRAVAVEADINRTLQGLIGSRGHAEC